jgi:hypothetical protein
VVTQKPPEDPAEHAREFALRWQDKLEQHCAVRMEELGLPDNKIGEPDYAGSGRWHVFDPHGRNGGNTVTGVVVDSGVLNPDLLKSQKGGRLWARARLRDRIDATIAHELAESECLDHKQALKDAARTKLPISPGARRICKAMAR